MSVVTAAIQQKFFDIVFKTAENIRLGLFYQHGPYEAVKEAVANRSRGVESGAIRFPLVWLVTPFREEHGHVDGVCLLPDLHILIITGTKPEVSEDRQISDVFDGQLRLIYSRLLHYIAESYVFQTQTAEAIPHTAVEWTYKAAGGGVDGHTNLFDACVCAIEIKGMRLIVNESVSNDHPLIPHN